MCLDSIQFTYYSVRWAKPQTSATKTYAELVYLYERVFTDEFISLLCRCGDYTWGFKLGDNDGVCVWETGSLSPVPGSVGAVPSALRASFYREFLMAVRAIFSTMTYCIENKYKQLAISVIFFCSFNTWGHKTIHSTGSSHVRYVFFFLFFFFYIFPSSTLESFEKSTAARIKRQLLRGGTDWL